MTKPAPDASTSKSKGMASSHAVLCPGKDNVDESHTDRSLARQRVYGTQSGVFLAIDRQQGVYRLSFDKVSLDQAGDEFFEQNIKPLLTRHRTLKWPQGTDGPEVRFYWQPVEKDWTIRFRFVDRDTDGTEVVRDGKRQYMNLHSQMQAIVTDTANTIDQLLSEKLGLRQSPKK